MAAILPPQGLPPPNRQVRSLRRTAQYLAAGVSVVVIGVVYYGLTHMGPSASDAAKEADKGKAEAASADVLQGAPLGGEIAARRKRQPAITPAATKPVMVPSAAEPTPAAPTTPPPPDDDMTEQAIAARKAAWQAYYQQLTETQQHRLEARRSAMSSDIEVTNVAAPGAGTPAGGLTPGNGNNAPRDFFAAHASSPETDYSPYTTTDPLGQYELKATDTITAKLVSSVNSDSPGIIKAIVTKSVMDHATGMHVLIPQGSTLVGWYDTSVAYGQTRLVTAWTRVLYPPPCDQSLDLGAMPGSDAGGSAAFQDITNNHWGQLLGAAALVSVFGAAAQLSQPPQSSFSTYSPMQTAAGAVGQQTTTLGSEVARKGLSVQPTEEIRNGYQFVIMATKDVLFAAPWQEDVCSSMDASARE